MKKSIFFILAITTCLLGNSKATGEIEYILLSHFQLAFIKISEEKTGDILCPDVENEYIVDLQSEGGRNIYAMLLTAKSLERPVSVESHSVLPCILGREQAALVNWVD